MNKQFPYLFALALPIVLIPVFMPYLSFYAAASVVFVKADSVLSESADSVVASESADTIIVSGNSGAIAARKKIVSISFNGNKTTKEKTLRMYLSNLGIDTGRIYDSVILAAAKRKLIMTNLFYKIDIVPLVKDDGVHLYVILDELGLFYFSPTGTIEYYRTTDKIDSWFRLYAGITKLNFRGRMETLTIKGMGWKDKFLGISWSKPLLPSTYYAGLGAGVLDYYELNYPRTRFVLSGRVTASKDLSLHSKGYISLSPTYSRIDTLIAGTSHTIIKLQEAYTSFGWSTDYRDNNFDTKKGWFFWNELLTNGVYSNDTYTYGQYNTEIRVYAPGLPRSAVIACRLQGTLRTNDAGPYRRLYAGGEGSVRGFPRDWLGMTGQMNNRIVLSTEYRFRIWTTPQMDFLSLSRLLPETKGLFYHFDGALIADDGVLWPRIGHPFKNENGGGIGAGIKIFAPTLRRSGCIEVVYPIVNHNLYAPEVLLYLDAYF